MTTRRRRPSTPRRSSPARCRRPSRLGTTCRWRASPRSCATRAASCWSNAWASRCAAPTTSCRTTSPSCRTTAATRRSRDWCCPRCWTAHRRRPRARWRWPARRCPRAASASASSSASCTACTTSPSRCASTRASRRCRRTLRRSRSQIDGQPWRLHGAFADLRPRGLLRHRYARQSPLDYLDAWLPHVLMCATAPSDVLPVTTGIARDGRFFFTECDEPRRVLETLLNLYARGLREPLAFFPSAAWAWVNGDRQGPSKAVAEFRPGGFNEYAEGPDAGYRLAMRGRPDPFAPEVVDAFYANAEAVFDPLLACLGSNECSRTSSNAGRLRLPARGIRQIEASAGTGKTWNICGLYLRLLLERRLEVQRILVVTFTNAATAELRERIRQRIVDTLAWLHAEQAGEPPAGGDDFVERLIRSARDRHGLQTDDMLARLELALATFDEAAIFTIHGFCQRALADTPFTAQMPLRDRTGARRRRLAGRGRQRFLAPPRRGRRPRRRTGRPSRGQQGHARSASPRCSSAIWQSRWRAPHGPTTRCRRARSRRRPARQPRRGPRDVARAARRDRRHAARRCPALSAGATRTTACARRSAAGTSCWRTTTAWPRSTSTPPKLDLLASQARDGHQEEAGDAAARVLRRWPSAARPARQRQPGAAPTRRLALLQGHARGRAARSARPSGASAWSPSTTCCSTCTRASPAATRPGWPARSRRVSRRR